MTTQIKKGTEVYMISNWNSKATVYVQKLTIQSFGKKQATATRFVNNEFLKSQIYAQSYFELYPVADVADVNSLALEIAKKQKIAKIQYYVNHAHGYCLHEIETGRTDHVNFWKSLRKDCEEVINEEPAVLLRNL